MSEADEAGLKRDLALGLSLGAASAAVTAVPAALRVTGSVSVALGVGVLLAGATALILGPLLAALLRLRARTPAGALGVRVSLLTFLIAAGPLAVLGATLKSGTHHRPLGGATFALLSLAVIVACAVGAWRLLAFRDSAQATWPRAGRIVWVFGAVVGAGVLTLLLVRLATTPGLVRAGVLDGLRALGLGAVALFLPIPAAARRVLGRWGLAIWVGLVLAALTLCRVPSLAAAADRAAPVLMAPVVWLSAGLGGG